MKKLFLLTLLIAALGSCKKDDHATEDTVAPNIEITSPLANAVYAVGDTVPIKGRMWDNNDLHEANISISHMQQGNRMMDCPMAVHQMKEHHFDTCYVVTTNDGNGLRLKVEAEDHSHNKAEKIVELQINN